MSVVPMYLLVDQVRVAELCAILNVVELGLEGARGKKVRWVQDLPALCLELLGYTLLPGEMVGEVTHV